MTTENTDEPWWDKYVDYKTHIPTEFFVPISEMDDLVSEAERRGQIEALNWLFHHASGGGDWRRKIEQKIGELKSI